MTAGVQCRRCAAVTPAPSKFCGTCGAPLVYVEEDVTVIAPAGPIPDEAIRPDARRGMDDMRTVLDQPAIDPSALRKQFDEARTMLDQPALDPVAARRQFEEEKKRKFDEANTVLAQPALDPRAVEAARAAAAAAAAPGAADMRTMLDAPRVEAVPARARPSMRTYIAGSTMPTKDGLPPVTAAEMERPAELMQAPAVPAAASAPRRTGPAGTERLPNLDPESDGGRLSSTAVFDYDDAAQQAPIAPPALAPGVANAPPAAAGARPGRAPQRTMLGMPSPLAGAPAPRPKAPGPDATIRGMPTPAEAPVSPAAAPRLGARTMVGAASLPGAGPHGGPPAGGQPRYDAAPAGPPSPTVQPVIMAPAPGPDERARTLELSQSSVGKLTPPPQAAQFAQTGPLVDPRNPHVPQGFGPPGAPPPFGGGPPQAGPVPVPVGPEAGPQAQIFPGAHPFSMAPNEQMEPSLDLRPKKKGGRGCAVFLIVSGILLLAGAGGTLTYFLVFGPRAHRSVTATVVRDPNGAETLSVQVLGAAAGTKVRFSGQEQPLAGSTARFPMPEQQLSIGENRLTLEVLRPGKPAQAHEVRLVVDYRVRADLTALGTEPPGYDVTVDARPGTPVQVEGRPVTLDVAGHGSVRFPLSAIPAAADGSAPLVHTVRYRVAPPDGTPSDGTLTTEIPRATLTVDRPGPETVTDREAIDVAGAADPDATVTIDGAAVPVQAGRFTARRPVALGETTLALRAQAPGKAPSTVTVRVRRVADLEAEARAFQADPEATYARLAVNPNLYRGRRATFTGVIYNMRVEQGQTIIQMLVRDCAPGQRCSLWVVYRGDTVATVGSSVRVLGTLAGEQTFRTPQGAQVTVPRLDASFVLAVRS